ncbi:hypothetical protein C0J52_13176 [Blattella germanica]|nr:hypothetical protein C0J52_13176 [Blattella germanica]
MGEFSPYQRVNMDNVGNHYIDTSTQPPTPPSQSHPFHDTLGNRVQLIENFVGNWVPNQSGTYSPFGCTDNRARQMHTKNQQGTQTLPIGLPGESLMDHKVIERVVKKDRKVAEVHPMRPSYSDVLAKSAATSTPAAKSNVSSPTNINEKSNITKSKVTVSKCGNGKRNNKGSSLKRQHSSGSDEHNGNGNVNSVKLNQNANLSQKTVGSSMKRNNLELGFGDLGLARKWVSLDDLDSKQAAEGIAKVRSNTQGGNTKKTSSKPKCEEEDDLFETTLNNHKPSPYPSCGKGACGLGGPSTKRPPIHINNNLGTSTWGSGRGAGTGEKNILKGSSSTKNCRPCPEDRKGSKADSKSSSVTTASTRPGSSRSSSTSGNQNSGGSEKPNLSKRRGKKKECQSPLGLIYRPIKLQLTCWSQIAVQIVFWFFHLLSDVLSMSGRLLMHLGAFFCDWLSVSSVSAWKKISGSVMRLKIFERFGFRTEWWNFWQKNKKPPPSGKSKVGNNFKDGIPPGLENNISLPSTGEEAMRRLLACRGKDPYSILGVTPHCSDDDIKKYYKRQAVLVHPDKNNQPGAEEAFKILVHAFELIGEPEQRIAYDRRVAETAQVETAWSELSELLAQLHKKMETAANSIRCTNCAKRHRRIPVERPCYAARFCAQCRIHHNAREGDIWAESSMFGFLWHYYACMDGGVYDITEWAACQADNMRHLRANTHSVQYRIVLGKQQHRHRAAPRSAPEPTSEPDLEDFLNNLYSQPGSRPDQGRNRKKGKRKK